MPPWAKTRDLTGRTLLARVAEHHIREAMHLPKIHVHKTRVIITHEALAAALLPPLLRLFPPLNRRRMWRDAEERSEGEEPANQKFNCTEP